MNCCCDGVDVEVSTRNSNLDYDLVCKILSVLPVKTLMRAKCVCKSWRYLVESDPHFIYLHYTQSKARPKLLISNKVNSEFGTSFSSAYLSQVIDHGEVVFKVTASLAEFMLRPVNALICFIRSREPAVLIYNLSTRKQTPWIETTTKSSWNYNQSYGFGFDPATKEHKVLCVLTKKRERTTSIMPSTTTHDHLRTDDDFCEVLTVGQNSWRRIDQVSPHKVCFHDAFYTNGALYWLCNGGDPHDFYLPDCIVVFDVGSEKFIRVIPIPNYIRRSPKHYWTKFLFIVDGRPALIDRTRSDDHEDDKTIKMWTFDDENWIEGTISLPSEEEKPVLLFSFEAIEGTDLIIIQSHRKTPEQVLSVYFYNTKKKTWTSPPGGGLTVKNAPTCCDSFSLDEYYNINYQISTFVESLFTLQI